MVPSSSKCPVNTYPLNRILKNIQTLSCTQITDTQSGPGQGWVFTGSKMKVRKKLRKNNFSPHFTNVNNRKDDVDDVELIQCFSIFDARVEKRG